MSRTFEFTSPSRRSKRLLASGYYHLPPNETANNFPAPSDDDDDTASIDSNISRSSFAAENRNVVYEESPPRRIFKRRRRNHSGSPARSPVLPGHSRGADTTVNRITLLKEKAAHKQVLVTSGQSTSAISRQRETTTSRGHAIHHLYGLQHEEEESYAGGEHVDRQVTHQSTVRRTNMQVTDGNQASQGDVFKTPTILPRPAILVCIFLLSTVKKLS